MKINVVQNPFARIMATKGELPFLLDPLSYQHSHEYQVDGQ